MSPSFVDTEVVSPQLRASTGKAVAVRHCLWHDIYVTRPASRNITYSFFGYTLVLAIFVAHFLAQATAIE